MIVKDHVAAATLTRDQDGYTATRTFIIDGVPGNAVAKLYNALEHPEIPRYGDLHPIIPGIQVVDVQASPLKNGDQIKIEAEYSTPSDDDSAEETSGLLTLTTGLISEEVITDVNGELLTVEHRGGTGRRIKYASADVQRPQSRVAFRRTERNSPKANIRKYLGKINRTDWSGFPAKTWLCSSINGTEKSGKFEVEYSFVYREDTWRVDLVFGISDEDAQDYPIDIDSGNGFARYDVYKTIDFNQLGLRF